MTQKELNYIRRRADQYADWAQEERREANQAQTQEEREEHLLQARLNECKSDTLLYLLTEINAKRHLGTGTGA